MKWFPFIKRYRKFLYPANAVSLLENRHFRSHRPPYSSHCPLIKSPHFEAQPATKNEGACSYLCVDKIKSRPSRCYRIARKQKQKNRAEQLSQNLVRPEDLGWSRFTRHSPAGDEKWGGLHWQLLALAKRVLKPQDKNLLGKKHWFITES